MIILLGPVGALVSECAHGLSERRGWPMADVEEIVPEIAGREASQIVQADGAAELASLEVAVSEALLADVAAGDERVLALGSASVGETLQSAQGEKVRARLLELRAEGAQVVHLTADIATLAHRTGLDGPRFASIVPPRALLFTQVRGRDALYAALATHTIDTSGLSVDGVVDAVDAL